MTWRWTTGCHRSGRGPRSIQDVWRFREPLTRSGAVDRLFARFDAVLRDAGYLAMGGQIVDATRGPGLPPG